MASRTDRHKRLLAVVVGAAAVLAGGDTALAAEAVERDQIYELKWIGVFVILLVAIHLSAPLLRKFLDKKGEARIFESFGGGLAIGYVALQLFPEFEVGQKVIGDGIYYFLLAGFVFFWGLEQRFVAAEATGSPSRTFHLHLTHACIYNWLLIYAMPANLSQGGLIALLGGIPIMVHLVYKDFLFCRHELEKFERSGRYILALAPLVGWVAVAVAEPSEWLSDVLIAILAGYILQSVFTTELPDASRTSFRWFLMGTVAYALLLALVPAFALLPGI